MSVIGIFRPGQLHAGTVKDLCGLPASGRKNGQGCSRACLPGHDVTGPEASRGIDRHDGRYGKDSQESCRKYSCKNSGSSVQDSSALHSCSGRMKEFFHLGSPPPLSAVFPVPRNRQVSGLNHLQKVQPAVRKRNTCVFFCAEFKKFRF